MKSQGEFAFAETSRSRIDIAPDASSFTTGAVLQLDGVMLI